MRRPLLAAALAVLLLGAGGCQTSIGNYFANRGRDFGDMFLIQGGIGYGLGVQVKAAGVAHVGLGALSFHRNKTLGIVYGDWRPSFRRRGRGVPSEGDLILLLPHLSNLPPEGGESHFCVGLFPALASWHNTSRSAFGGNDKWLWSQGTPAFRKAQVHAFDVEASVTAIFLSLRIGFSPGELVDFILGWFGVDIAADDRELGGGAPGEEEPGEAAAADGEGQPETGTGTEPDPPDPPDGDDPPRDE